MDVLTDLLERARARGAGFSHSTVRGPFGLAFPSVPGLAVHAIVEGELQLWTDDAAHPERLIGGDLVLVKGGLDHHLATSPERPLRPLLDFMDARARSPTAASSPARAPRRPCSSAAPTCSTATSVPSCCACSPRSSACGPPPGVPCARRWTCSRARWSTTTRASRRCWTGCWTWRSSSPCASTSASAGAPAWYRASSDPQLGPALRAVHAEPAKPWTVESLAAEASLSRAAFARRFTAALGVAPLTYLTGWRMALAREQLRDSDDQIAAVASALGYASEFSFAAAFKRHHGLAPGRWRANTRAERSHSLSGTRLATRSRAPG